MSETFQQQRSLQAQLSDRANALRKEIALARNKGKALQAAIENRESSLARLEAQLANARTARTGSP